MTIDKLSEIKARRAAIEPVTPEMVTHGITVYVEGYSTVPGGKNGRECLTKLAMYAPHGVFIARAPKDIDWLVAEVERLRSELRNAPPPWADNDTDQLADT